MASPASVVSAVTMSPPTGSEAPGCDPQLAAVTAERKRKRKESNRLSAQRSRARKQRQLDELTDQVAALRARNGAMAAAAYDIERRCAAVQAENTLLQAMNLELGERLQSLTELIQWMEGAMYHQPQPQPQLLDANMYNYY
ncbi:hypothetical protein SEVIR_5G193800v4 [Setaria viridis]|uniref:BZIP domain-containing protein n=1 Tax=Setaria viridis TaxID=4556 RepID=A0A4U6UIJ6_SETVI|nr:ocs element-binding factor 1-like [Setaria viridis]TKW14835.1 hypothetical protein SEVIR_5G193800v2 [Setaria viridis]